MRVFAQALRRVSKAAGWCVEGICETRPAPVCPARCRSWGPSPARSPGPSPARSPRWNTPAQIPCQHAQNPMQWPGQTERSSFSYRSCKGTALLLPPVSCGAEIRPDTFHRLHGSKAELQIPGSCFTLQGRIASPGSWVLMELTLLQSGQHPQCRWDAWTAAAPSANIYISVLCIP